MANIEDFKPFISPEVPGVDVITLENQLRYSINEFCEKTWIIQKGFTHDVDADDIYSEMNNTAVISLPGYVRDLRPIWIANLLVDGNSWDVQYLDLINDTPDLEMLRESSSKVFNFPSLTTIRLGPFTSACRVFLKLVFKPTPTASSFDDVLLNDWARGISAGVKSELMAMPGMPWTNPAMAQYYRDQFMREVGEAKVKISKDYTQRGKSIQPREYGF